jgi:hypothetical protein
LVDWRGEAPWPREVAGLDDSPVAQLARETHSDTRAPASLDVAQHEVNQSLGCARVGCRFASDLVDEPARIVNHGELRGCRADVNSQDGVADRDGRFAFVLSFAHHHSPG